MKYDFHIHTTSSDGTYTPKEIVVSAIERGLDGVAISDHDTIDGIEIAMKESEKHDGFTVIPGIEFSCTYEDEEVHILGYLFNLGNDDLIKVTNRLKEERKIRAYKMVERLKEIDIEISIDDLLKENKEISIGRPHIARKLVELNYCNSVQNAFELYLKKGKPGYVPRFKLQISDTINLIQNAGGIAILAHPGLLKNKEVINVALDAGIDGIEVYHPKNGKTESKKFKKIVKDKNLIYTAGSDFHGDKKNSPTDFGDYCIETESTMEQWLLNREDD